MALQKRGVLKAAAGPLAYVAYATEDVRSRALKIASTLRSAGIPADYDMLGRALRKQLDDASAKGAAITVIAAAGELAEGKVVVRSMKDGTESKQPVAGIADVAGRMLRA